MDTTTLGKWVMGAGGALLGLGGLIWLLGRWGLPLGRLPGDIHFEGRGFSFYFPLTTGILVSIGLTIVINLLFRLFRR